jgi:UDP-2-acetamido-3-amino-2,3-dideoxy-glucuronate N-acetyltransferase
MKNNASTQAPETAVSGTETGQFSVLSPGAVLGADVKISSHVFVPNDAVVGDRVQIGSGVYLPEGIRVGDDVKIEANVAFARCLEETGRNRTTTIHRGCVIGTNATVHTGITIGRQAVIAPGSLVEQDAPAYSIIEGSPGRIVGYSAQKANALRPTLHAPLDQMTGMEGVGFVALTKVSDMRGDLLAIELDRQIPFVVKRVFTVMNVPSHHVRGEHAHKECHQLLVCLQGAVTVAADNGTDRREWVLDRPDIGLHIKPMTWAAQYRYSADAVLAVFASHSYDAGDYIRDYEEFLAAVKRN